MKSLLACSCTNRIRNFFGIMVTFVFFCIFSVTPVYAAEQSTEGDKEDVKLSRHAVEAKQKDEVIEVTISAAGDCTLGIDTRLNHTFETYYNKYGDKYFFKGVKDIFENDDITIVNLEGPLTSSNYRVSKTYNFKGPARYANILVEGSVEVVTLGNNHTLDYGQQGLSDTKKALKKYGVKYCIDNTIAYKTVNGVKVAFLGYLRWSDNGRDAIKNNIKTARKKGADIIIVSFHCGVEGDYYPCKTQKSLYRMAIDEGASLVLGHHPHVLQGIEKYKGRYIVYSLGNFCFGGNSNPSDKDTMIFQQTFTVKNGKLLKTDDVQVIPCSLSSTTRTNDYQPTVLTGDGKKRWIQKMNKLSKGMGVEFDGDGIPKTKP